MFYFPHKTRLNVALTPPFVRTERLFFSEKKGKKEKKDELPFWPVKIEASEGGGGESEGPHWKPYASRSHQNQRLLYRPEVFATGRPLCQPEPERATSPSAARRQRGMEGGTGGRPGVGTGGRRRRPLPSETFPDTPSTTTSVATTTTASAKPL